MHAERTQQSIESILRQEVVCTQRLVACLDAERSALTQRDMTALESIIQEKVIITQQLEELEQQREKLLARLGYANDKDGLQRCFRRFANSDILTGLWREIIDNIENARDGNLANGGILESSRHYAEQALCMLRGQTGTPSVYNPAGDTSAHLGQRELGKV